MRRYLYFFFCAARCVLATATDPRACSHTWHPLASWIIRDYCVEHDFSCDAFRCELHELDVSRTVDHAKSARTLVLLLYRCHRNNQWTSTRRCIKQWCCCQPFDNDKRRICISSARDSEVATLQTLWCPKKKERKLSTTNFVCITSGKRECIGMDLLSQLVGATIAMNAKRHVVVRASACAWHASWIPIGAGDRSIVTFSQCKNVHHCQGNDVDSDALAVATGDEIHIEQNQLESVSPMNMLNYVRTIVSAFRMEHEIQ